MVAYARFRKVTSRGILEEHVAVEGKAVFRRSRRAVNKKTGRVAGGYNRSTTRKASAAAAQATYDQAVRDLLSERFSEYAGPSLPTHTEARASRRASNTKATPRAGEAKKAALGKATRSSPSPSTRGRAKPSGEPALVRFERRHTVRLPEGYRRFVTAHGAAEILGFVYVHAPRSTGKFKLEALIATMRLMIDAEGDAARKRRLGTLLPFADSGGGDTFAWDRRELIANAEPPVWWCPRDGRIKKVADTFDQWLTKLLSDRRFVDALFLGLDVDCTIRCV